MKKFTRLFAVISSAVMLFSLLGIAPVTAAETTEKLYTLSELMEMSDEEFMALEGAEDVCNNIRDVLKQDQEFAEYFEMDDYEITLNGEFKKIIRFPFTNDYTANITEKKIAEVLGDETVFDITSPLESEIVSDNLLTVYFREYECVAPTEENIINFARCGYCIRQIIDLTCISSSIVWDSNSYCSVEAGDVNIDTAVDLYDVIWIASDLADIFKLTESQQKIGDVNEDSVCDLYDAIAIAETIMEK